MVSSFARAGRRVFRRSGMKKRAAYRRRPSSRRAVSRRAPRRVYRRRTYKRVASRVPGKRLYAMSY